MMPVNLQLRKMIIKNIPAITEEDIRRYEALVLLRFRIFVQENIDSEYLKVSAPTGKTYHVLNNEDETSDITKPFEENSRKLKQLKNIWIARRRLALLSAKFITPSYPRENLTLWFQALKAYFKLQLQNMPLFIKYWFGLKLKFPVLLKK